MEKMLVISGQLNNLNDYTDACRESRFTGAKMKKENEYIITAYIKMQLKNIHFTGKVFIEFRWFEPNRKRDLDNVAFAKKFILDALVNNEIIESDGWKGIAGFTDSFEVDRENPRIEVVIRNQENEN